MARIAESKRLGDDQTTPFPVGGAAGRDAREMGDLPEVSVSPKELIFEGGDASKPIARHLALTNPHNRGESPPGSDASRIPRAGACDRWRPARRVHHTHRQERGRTDGLADAAALPRRCVFQGQDDRAAPLLRAPERRAAEGQLVRHRRGCDRAPFSPAAAPKADTHPTPLCLSAQWSCSPSRRCRLRMSGRTSSSCRCAPPASRQHLSRSSPGSPLLPACAHRPRNGAV